MAEPVWPLIVPYWNWNLDLPCHKTIQTPANRTILELKHDGDIAALQSDMAANRTILELKHLSGSFWGKLLATANRTILELKLEIYHCLCFYHGPLIVPYWNWNASLQALTRPFLSPANRTILELKLTEAQTDSQTDFSANRTILELKHTFLRDLQIHYLR